MTIRTILLPGMDGTGRLFRSFCNAAPTSHETKIVELPEAITEGYAGLAGHVAGILPTDQKVLLVGESFSGPIATRIAAEHPDRVLGLVLVATFVDSPTPSLAKVIPWRTVMGMPLPTIAVRWVMLGRDAPMDQVREVQNVAKAVPSATMADRMKLVNCVNEMSALQACKCPLLYIRPTADRLVPKRCWQVIRRLRPDAKLAEVKGPHLILQRNPTDAWRHIVEFTDSLTACPGIESWER